jgi:phosphatidylglycerol:prolipoprotein diacylglycerol transferase
MHPILFQVGPFVLPTYGLFAVLAFLAGLLLVRRYAGVEGLDRRQTMDAFFYTMIVGFVGARAFEALVHWESFAANPKVLLFSTGTFLGGLVSALLFAFFWFRRIGLPLLLGFDLIGLLAAVAIGVGRWGCFASGCCWGTPTDLPWAVTFPEMARAIHAGLPEVPLHPTQAYLALNSLLILGVLVLVYRRKRFHGQIIMLYLMLYGASRFVLEFLRGDSRPVPVAGLTLDSSQLFLLGVVALGAAGHLYLARRHRLSGEPDWQPACRRDAKPPAKKGERRRSTRRRVKKARG